MTPWTMDMRQRAWRMATATGKAMSWVSMGLRDMAVSARRLVCWIPALEVYANILDWEACQRAACVERQSCLAAIKEQL